MEVNIINVPSSYDWQIVYDHAMATTGKSHGTVTPEWQCKILASEHSPIRDLWYRWEWVDLPYWVSVHLVRHKIGITHYVKSQRNDRQDDYDRNTAPQNAPVIHRVTANAQAIINISKLRLCKNAADTTRAAWSMFLNALSVHDDLLPHFCVPSCVYRNGLCTEFHSCGYNTTLLFDADLSLYTTKVRSK